VRALGQAVALLRALLPAHEQRTPVCWYYLPSVLFDFVRDYCKWKSYYFLGVRSKELSFSSVH
jgi:hypothetical protein